MKSSFRRGVKDGLVLMPAIVLFGAAFGALAVEAGLAALLRQLSTLGTPAVAALVLVDRSISYLSVIAIGAALFLVRWVARRKRRPGQNGTASPSNQGA